MHHVGARRSGYGMDFGKPSWCFGVVPQTSRKQGSPVHAALQRYASEVAAVRGEGLVRGQPGDVAERFFALGFSLEQMRQNLTDLDRVIGEWSESSPATPAATEDQSR